MSASAALLQAWIVMQSRRIQGATWPAARAESGQVLCQVNSNSSCVYTGQNINSTTRTKHTANELSK